MKQTKTNELMINIIIIFVINLIWCHKKQHFVVINLLIYVMQLSWTCSHSIHCYILKTCENWYGWFWGNPCCYVPYKNGVYQKSGRSMHLRWDEKRLLHVFTMRSKTGQGSRSNLNPVLKVKDIAKQLDQYLYMFSSWNSKLFIRCKD